jgi:hypothetical protein
MINRTVLFSALVIGLSGTIQSFVNTGKISRALIGTFVFVLLLSLVDAIGGGASQLASALAILAMLYVLLTQFPWQQLASAVGVKTKQA